MKTGFKLSILLIFLSYMGGQSQNTWISGIEAGIGKYVARNLDLKTIIT